MVGLNLVKTRNLVSSMTLKNGAALSPIGEATTNAMQSADKIANFIFTNFLFLLKLNKRLKSELILSVNL